jgi:hypothetical protein
MLQIYQKALLLGFTNGLFVGRTLRNGKYECIRRFFNNRKKRKKEIKG